MKQNKIVIIIGIIVILSVLVFMALDFFVGLNRPQRNIHKFNIDKFNEVDSTLIEYSEVLSFPSDMDFPKAIATDKNDNIYVTGNNNILVYDKNGYLKKDFITDVDAQSICVNEANDIFLGVTDHIEVWNAKGELKNKWKAVNQKAVITSIAVNEESVFVADAGNKVVYHFDLDGNLINEIGRKDSLTGIQGFVIPSPYFDLAIGRDDEIWVVNSGRHQLESYDKEGNLKSSWKKTSMRLDGFSGCCNPSHISILPDGSFVTSEKGIVRVKIHQPSGEFKSVVAAPNQFEKGTRGLDLAVDSKNRVIILDPMKGLIRIFKKQ
jgi:hypothetical protein